MNWNQLRYFLEVARGGSATAAAKMLGVSHGTVIRQIDELENVLGARLFDHLQTGYQLTESGRDILAAVESMEEASLSVERELKGKDREPSGLLRVSIPERALLDLSGLIKGFNQHYPQIELALYSGAEITNLNRLEADVVLRLTTAPPEMLVGRELCDISFSVYAHQDYLKRHGLDINTVKAQHCRWILWLGTQSSPLPVCNQPDQLLRAAVNPMQVVMSSDAMDDIVAAISQGLGVGLLADHRASQIKGLQRLPFDRLVRSLGLHRAGLWLLSHRDLRSSAKVKAFKFFIQNKMRGYIDI